MWLPLILTSSPLCYVHWFLDRAFHIANALLTGKVHSTPSVTNRLSAPAEFDVSESTGHHSERLLIAAPDLQGSWTRPQTWEPT